MKIEAPTDTLTSNGNQVKLTWLITIQNATHPPIAAASNTFTSTFGAESECIGIDASLRKSAAKFDDSENASSKKETLFIVVHFHMIFSFSFVGIRGAFY